MSLNNMDKEVTIKAIRKESLDLPTNKLITVLDQFQLTSYSQRQLDEMSLNRLRDMLGIIRRLIILEGD